MNNSYIRIGILHPTIRKKHNILNTLQDIYEWKFAKRDQSCDMVYSPVHSVLTILQFYARNQITVLSQSPYLYRPDSTRFFPTPEIQISVERTLFRHLRWHKNNFIKGIAGNTKISLPGLEKCVNKRDEYFGRNKDE